MLLKYLLTNFEMVSVGPVIAGYNLCFYVTHTLYFYNKVLLS